MEYIALCDKKLKIEKKNIPRQVIPLSEPGATIRNLVIRETKNTLRDLSPGATYELQLYTVFENKESQVIFPLQIFLHQCEILFTAGPPLDQLHDEAERPGEVHRLVP